MVAAAERSAVTETPSSLREETTHGIDLGGHRLYRFAMIHDPEGNAIGLIEPFRR